MDGRSDCKGIQTGSCAARSRCDTFVVYPVSLKQTDATSFLANVKQDVLTFMRRVTVCVQPGGRMLASGSADETIRLWNVEVLVAEGLDEAISSSIELKVYGAAVRCCSFSPSGALLCRCSLSFSSSAPSLSHPDFFGLLFPSRFRCIAVLFWGVPSSQKTAGILHPTSSSHLFLSLLPSLFPAAARSTNLSASGTYRRATACRCSRGTSTLY